MLTLSTLIQNSVNKLGRGYHTRTTCTGGSLTTFEDTKLEDKFQDDGPKNGTVIVTMDAGGLGAAPEGEFSRITAYDTSTYAGTFSPAMTAAIDSGDEILVINAALPMLDMIAQCNEGLRQIGKIPVYDDSITTTDNTYLYQLPIGIKGGKIIRIEHRLLSTDEWEAIPQNSYEVVPETPGTASYLQLKASIPAGYTLKIWYMSEHPKLTAYDDAVSEAIPDELAILYCAVAMFDWLGVEESKRQQYNALVAQLEEAKAKFKVSFPQMKNKTLSLWNEESHKFNGTTVQL